MAETKTIQKGMRFSPYTVQQLEALCKKEKRSEQNMVEVLIADRYEDEFGCTPISVAIESVSKSRVADVAG